MVRAMPLTHDVARILGANRDSRQNADWRSGLICHERSGQPRALLANALLALRQSPECNGIVAYNEFSGRAVVLKKTPWNAAAGTEWSDQQDRLATEWLQAQGIHVTVGVASEAVETVARERSFHPLREELTALEWDGKPRVETWLRDYLGVADSDYSRAVGSRWLISAVARVFKPGCKADCCLIIEGAQGIGKSTTFQVLGGKYFTDEISDLGSKDAAMQAMGAWIIEIAELDSMSRGEVGRIKAFMSRTEDRFRPPFGRRVINSARQCVFAGTVNHSSYLRDETGARRFWPVQCTGISLEALKHDRDQLWAEAVAAFKAGRAWWLDTPELVEAAAREQSERYESDPWEDPMAKWIATKEDVSVSEVLDGCLGKKQNGSWQLADKYRVARCLKSLGWERFHARTVTTSTGREWRYRRADQ